MTEDVVVLGAGYAGTRAVQNLQRKLGDEIDLTWVSKTDYHFVLHESHRIVRDPSVKDKLIVPVDDVKDPSTRFVQGEVEALDCDDREVRLADGSTISYDWCVVAIGSRTAFFGIEGLRENAHTLKSLDDALDIHEDVKQAARDASRADPAQVVVGGAGLSGIQTAGEIAEFRDKHRAPIDVHLVEGLDNVFPPGEPELQERIASMLRDLDVDIETGEFITEVDDDTVYVGEDAEMDYDVLVWTGGITGQECAEDAGLEKDARSNRFDVSSTFRTSDERVFALGDSALIDQADGEQAPPTAQAAWQAGPVVAENVKRAMNDQPLEEWTYVDHGTTISVGDDAVAFDIEPVSGIRVPVDLFSGLPAKQLKKAIAARWINSVVGPVNAARAWPDL